MWQAEAGIELGAIRANIARLRAGTSAEIMAVVKADGYGHGAVQVARAALEAGATRLGVATLAEALELRDSGVTAPILAWLLSPGQPRDVAIAAVEVSLGAEVHDATAVIHPTKHFIIKLHRLQDIHHIKDDVGRAQHIAAEVEDHFSP